MKVFLSAALGDVLTVEAHFPPALRENLTHLYLASKPARAIAELFEGHAAYPKLEHIEILWDRFDQTLACFNSLHECQSHLRRKGLYRRIDQIEDWSIATIFPRIRRKQLKFTGSSFAKRTCEGDYVVIHPVTNSIPVRHFQEPQWKDVSDMLCRLKCRGVVLGAGDMPIPSGLEKYDTSISDAIELTANAAGFIGVDSSLSVAAGLCLPSDRLRVFTDNRHCQEWKDIYYPLAADYRFLIWYGGLTRR